MDDFEKCDEYINFIGSDLHIDNFEKRIKVQKLAYLFANLFNLEKLLESFNYYIRGPYSPQWAKYYYDNKGAARTEKTELDAEVKGELERVGFVKDLSAEDLEIMASLLFIEKMYNLDEDRAEQKLKEQKPYLSMEKIWRGSQLLKRFMLKPMEAKKIIGKLKQETEKWDEASAQDFDSFDEHR
jgi:uncharacterized protein YwgA